MEQKQQYQYLRDYARGLELWADMLRQWYVGLYDLIGEIGPGATALAQSVGMGAISNGYQSLDQSANDFEDVVRLSVQEDKPNIKVGLQSVADGKTLLDFTKSLGKDAVGSALQVHSTLKHPHLKVLETILSSTFDFQRSLETYVAFLEDFWGDLNGDPGGVPFDPPPHMDWDGFGSDWDKWTDFDPKNPHTGKTGFQIGDATGKGNFVPVTLTTSQKLRPIASLFDAVKPHYQGEAAITIHLPSGMYEGACIGGSGWSDAPRYEAWWTGKRSDGGNPDIGLAFPADNSGWLLEAGPLSQSYGQTFGVHATSSSEQRYCSWNLCCYGSGDNSITAGRYKNFDPKHSTVYHQFWGQMRGHKGGASNRTIRPISTNAASHVLFGVDHSEPEAKEHNKYDRNPSGNVGFVDCFLHGSGGQLLQVVNRKEEGILMPGVLDSTVLFVRTFASKYNRYPDRAANGISPQGSCMHLLVSGGAIIDTPEMHAGAVHKDVQGMIGLATGGDSDRTYSRPSGAPQGTVRVEDHVSANIDHDRAPWQFDCEELEIVNSSCWGKLEGHNQSRSIEVVGNVKKLTVQGCNQQSAQDDPRLAKAVEIMDIKGLDHGKLHVPDVRRKGVSLGSLDTLSIAE